MTDRIPGAPGRYSAVVPSEDVQKMQKGEAFSITLSRDDAPVEQGTPYSKATVLPDKVAAAICPDIADPTPADAFSALKTEVDGKAPAGYISESGYCDTYADFLTKLESIYNSMQDGEKRFVQLDAPIMSSPFNGEEINDAWFIEINRYDDHQGLIIANGIYFGECKLDFYGEWNEWEWVNPPLQEGVEYRTTEKFSPYDDAAVYAKLIYCGRLPNATFKEFFMADNIGHLVRVEGYLKNNNGYTADKIPITSVENNVVDVRLYNNSSLRLTTSSDQSSWEAYIAVYYTTPY